MSLSEIPPAARHVVALVLAALLTVTWSAPAGSQLTPKAEAQGRILKSSHLQHEALRALRDPGYAEQLVREAQEELQAAQKFLSGGWVAETSKDPLSTLNTKRIERALALLQRAGDTLSATIQRQAEAAATAERLEPPSPARPDYVEVVRTSLMEALRLTNSVIVF
jgi:hypothetical protein